MLNRLVKAACHKVMNSRPPDVVIGEPDDPYLLRWWVIPRNRWLNLYLHRILKSDDDRALHDHPWINMSYLVEGGYYEVTPDPDSGFGNRRTWRTAGEFKCRKPTALHRLELKDDDECVTLFLTGPRVRTWGFQCPNGWVKWLDFTRKTPEGNYVAKGCGDIDPSLLAPHASKSGFWPRPPERMGA